MTPLNSPLRRALVIDGTDYTLVIDAAGLKLTEKGRRNGTEFRWQDLVNGDAAMASALQASTDSPSDH